MAPNRKLPIRIFPSKDARSTVNAANLPKTCGNCHTGAGNHFVIGPVHVLTASGPAHPAVKWIRWTYWLLIPLTLGFMIAHNLLDFLAKKRAGLVELPADLATYVDEQTEEQEVIDIPTANPPAWISAVPYLTEFPWTPQD